MIDIRVNRRGSTNLTILVLVQVVLLGGIVVAGGYRAYQVRNERQLPTLREEPLEVRPLHDRFQVITDEQLRRTLLKLRPKFYGNETKIGHTDHNLRFWGDEPKFEKPFVSGADLRDLLLDHRKFAALYGPQQPPLLMDTEEGGLRIREFEGKGSASHDDHTMACLAEVGTPLSYEVITPQRKTSYRAIVEQSLRDFSLNQVEYEWSTLTYALFVNQRSWVTHEGQTVDFDMLARRIMRQKMPQGVCFGNHRLHSLVIILRVSDQLAESGEPLLSEVVREEVISYLQEMTTRLVQHQHEYGFWNRNWPTDKPASATPTDEIGDELSSRLIATGHALEWWAFAPAEVLPPNPTLAAAGQWLVRTVAALTDEQVREYNSFLSHVGRALSLWRGKFPHEVDLNSSGN